MTHAWLTPPSISRRKLLQAAAAILPLRAAGNELNCDVAVIGGGVGGFAAALGALREGMRVVLTEETDWIGGQLTAQAVPPDEHPWIEAFGSTRAYRNYRNSVRDYYRANFPLTAAARSKQDLNPGNGSVSRLTHEFRVSVAVLEAVLEPYRSNGQLTVLYNQVPESATTTGDRVTSVTLRGGVTVTAKYFLDATELGDLLPLVKAEFVTGAESQAQTGEEHASATAQPANSQSFTYCFAMDHIAGEDHTIEKPAEYGFWREYVPKMTPPWSGPLLNWTACDPRTLGPRQAYFEPNPTSAKPGLNYWLYRQIADPANFAPGTYRSGITLVNWPQNDYWLGDLITATPAERTGHLNRAKQLSLSFLYWMQTDQGWKGLRLRKDVVGTADGLAKSAYVRESRRIQAEFTILEQHVSPESEAFPDSVGVGCYRIDLHPSAGGTNYIDISSFPFQIPLGALIPKRLDNLLPACKNLGTTHITNGCYRLHPVEWNIGESAGALAAQAVKTKQSPRAIRNNKKLLADFQRTLTARGVELAWPKIRAV